MSKLRKLTRAETGETIYCFYCPGCKYMHQFLVDGPMRWDFNGNMEKPTFNPSLLVNESHPESRCHSFVREGKIQYCGDCHHDLKGKTVELPDLDPDTGWPKEEDR